MYGVCSKSIEIDKLLSKKVLRVSLRGKKLEDNAIHLDLDEGELTIHICSKEELENVVGYLGENIKEINTTKVESNIIENFFIVNIEEEQEEEETTDQIKSWEDAIAKVKTLNNNEYIVYKDSDKNFEFKNLNKPCIVTKELDHLKDLINGDNDYWWLFTNVSPQNQENNSNVPSVRILFNDKENYTINIDKLAKTINFCSEERFYISIDFQKIKDDWFLETNQDKWNKLKKLAQSKIDKSRTKNNKNLEDKKGRIKKLKDRIKAWHSNKIKGILNQNLITPDRFEKDFQAVKEFKYIKKIVADELKLLIYFEDFPCRAMSDREVMRTIKIPECMVSLEKVDNNRFALRGHSDAKSLRNKENIRDFAHPHCPNVNYGNYNNACLGNYETEINRAAIGNDIYTLVSLIREWMMSANVNDQWGDKALDKKTWEDWEGDES